MSGVGQVSLNFEKVITFQNAREVGMEVILEVGVLSCLLASDITMVFQGGVY